MSNSSSRIQRAGGAAAAGSAVAVLAGSSQQDGELALVGVVAGALMLAGSVLLLVSTVRR